MISINKGTEAYTIVFPCIAIIEDAKYYNDLKKPLKKGNALKLHNLLQDKYFGDLEEVLPVSICQLYSAEHFVNKEMGFELENVALVYLEDMIKQSPIPIKGQYWYSSTGKLYPEEITPKFKNFNFKKQKKDGVFMLHFFLPVVLIYNEEKHLDKAIEKIILDEEFEKLDIIAGLLDKIYKFKGKSKITLYPPSDIEDAVKVIQKLIKMVKAESTSYDIIVNN